MVKGPAILEEVPEEVLLICLPFLELHPSSGMFDRNELLQCHPKIRWHDFVKGVPANSILQHVHQFCLCIGKVTEESCESPASFIFK